MSEAVAKQVDKEDLFSEDSIDALEEEFGENFEKIDEKKDKPTKDKSEKPEKKKEETDEETEEEPDFTPDEEDVDVREPGEGDEDGSESDEASGDEPEPEEYVWELRVDGEDRTVESEGELVDWAQKGMSLEKKSSETQQLAQDAQFTMNAIINDPMGFLEEMSVSQICGTRTPGFDDYERARGYVAGICEKYLGPYLKEIAAPEEEKRALKAERQLEQERKRQDREQQAKQEQYTQEDVEWMQNLQHDMGVALQEFDLPDSAPIRGRMATLMDEAIEAGRDMHPQEAAKVVAQERDEYLKSIGSVSSDQGKPDKKAAIKEAKAKKSHKKAGVSKRGKRPRKKVVSMNSRDFMDKIDEAYGLDRY